MKNKKIVPAQIIQIETPKKYLLDGLFLGLESAKTCLIFMHGLGGSLFSHNDLNQSLVAKDRAVIILNNRGSYGTSRLRKIDKRLKSGETKINAGMAQEKFIDSEDDIAGAVNYAFNLGAKRIILIGHSTGCQKIVYYLSRFGRVRRQKGQPKASDLIAGAILLAPTSDYADFVANTKKSDYQKMIKFAQKMVKEGRGNLFLPPNISIIPFSAHRFLSLFHPDSVEEIFTYASKKEPKALKKVNVNLLIALPELDQFRDRKMSEIADWFKEKTDKDKTKVIIFNQANHGFYGKKLELKCQIEKWLKDIE